MNRADPGTTAPQLVFPRENEHDLHVHHATRFTFCGIDFVDLSPEDGPAAIAAWAEETRRTGLGRHVHLVNAYTIALAHRHPELLSVLRDENAVNLVDGTPVVWAARRAGLVSDANRAVRGPGLFADALGSSAADTLVHYFHGGSPETLHSLLTCIAEEHQGTVVAGADSPPFRELTLAEQVDRSTRIGATSATVVWIGLGTPKQDHVAADVAARTGKLAVAVGAAFDFAAGTKREAPRWMHGTGLEWSFRLLMEPCRLAPRYVVGNFQFARTVMQHRRRPV